MEKANENTKNLEKPSVIKGINAPLRYYLVWEDDFDENEINTYNLVVGSLPSEIHFQMIWFQEQ